MHCTLVQLTRRGVPSGKSPVAGFTADHAMSVDIRKPGRYRCPALLQVSTEPPAHTTASGRILQRNIFEPLPAATLRALLVPGPPRAEENRPRSLVKPNPLTPLHDTTVGHHAVQDALAGALERFWLMCTS